MRLVLSLALVALVAACGIDGTPKPPAAAPVPGVSVTGEASMGIKVGQ